MWLRNGNGHVIKVPESMPDTIRRCLGEGWVEVPDPNATPPGEPVDAPQAAPAHVEAPAPAPEPPRRSRFLTPEPAKAVKRARTK